MGYSYSESPAKRYSDMNFHNPCGDKVLFLALNTTSTDVKAGFLMDFLGVQVYNCKTQYQERRLRLWIY